MRRVITYGGLRDNLTKLSDVHTPILVTSEELIPNVISLE